jgi:hypothetical protein
MDCNKWWIDDEVISGGVTGMPETRVQVMLPVGKEVDLARESVQFMSPLKEQIDMSVTSTESDAFEGCCSPGTAFRLPSPSPVNKVALEGVEALQGVEASQGVIDRVRV